MSSQRVEDGMDGVSLALSASTEVYETLSTPRRAAVVAVLGEQEVPIETSTLARHVAALESGKPVDSVSPEEHRAVLVSLHHHHLPKLSSHRIVEWNRDASAVRFADEIALATQISSSHDVGVRSNRLFRTLSQSRRRVVLSVLTGVSAPISTSKLARLVAAREKRANPAEVGARDVDRIHVSLRHSHLPALASAGLIQYDPESDRVEG